MKTKSLAILLATFMFCVPFVTNAQNSITIHLSDTVLTIHSVDSIYYGYSQDSMFMQHVVTYDSTYTFEVDQIDSMKYTGPRITANGIVTGGDSNMLVVSLTDIQPLNDTSFSLMVYSGWNSQIIAATDQDTMPIMLYRGPTDGEHTIVLDTLSTVEALTRLFLPLEILAISDYATFDSLLHNADSFSTLYQLVGNSISSRRSLLDTANNRMYNLLSEVISQMVGLDDTLPPAAKTAYYMGNNTILVQTSGSLVRMRMWDLNPTYYGTITNGTGDTISDHMRIPTRADYGIMDLFFNRSLYGDYADYDMTDGGDGIKLFDFSCRNLPAKRDFILSTFLLPAASAIFDITMMRIDGHCLDKVLAHGGQVLASQWLDGWLYNEHNYPSSTDWKQAAWTASTNIINTILDISFEPIAGSGFIMYDPIYAGCLPRPNLAVAGKILGIVNLLYSGGKIALNTSGRIHYYRDAPDDISFCLEKYGSGSIHKCSQPNLMCHSGNGQQGDPDSLLSEPIVLQMNALDEDGNRVERRFHLHLRVSSGGGMLSDTLFDVTTDYIYDIQRQVYWTLGSDSTQPQQVTAWLTDPTMSNTTIGTPITISAFFRQQETRVDSFRVAANRYVSFSPGNLQYQPSTSSWRFAERQYDLIGSDNINLTNNDTSYSGWVDLFSWATAYNPTFVPRNNTYYDTMPVVNFFDWGIHPITNGSAQMNMWRTPTFAEWNYVINRRTNHDSLYTYATVCNVHGMILLPDNWIMPDSVTFIPQQHNWTSNVYDSTSWALMEDAGAIFLPAAGFRCIPNASSSTLTIHQLGNAGAYWSASGHVYYPTYGNTPSQHAYRMSFFGSTGNPPQGYLSVECYYGNSVRLIRNL